MLPISHPTSRTIQCRSKPPDLLALDLLISSYISLTNNTNQSLHIHWPRICLFFITCHEPNYTVSCFPSSWLGSCHFQSTFMNKTMQIYASTSPGPESAQFTSHFINKTIQIQASRSTGPGPAHFQSHFINKTIQIQASKHTLPGRAHFE